MQIAGIPKDLDDLKRKLKVGEVLTGKERLFLYQLVDSFENSGRPFKRKSDGTSPATKCKKVQVDVDDMKQVHTVSAQTADNGKTLPDSGENIPSSELPGSGENIPSSELPDSGENIPSSEPPEVSNGHPGRESGDSLTHNLSAPNLLDGSINQESGDLPAIPDSPPNLTLEQPSDLLDNFSDGNSEAPSYRRKARKSVQPPRANKRSKTVAPDSHKKRRARKSRTAASEADVRSVESRNSGDRFSSLESEASTENEAKSTKSARQSSRRKSARFPKSDAPSAKKPYIEKLLSNKNNPGTSKDNILQSKHLAKQEKVDPAKARKLMDEGFDARRTFILLETPVVAMVKERYPLLFSRSEVINEFDRITNAGRCDDFMKNIAGYSQSILGMQREDDTLLLRTLKIANEAVTQEQKLYALEVGALLMISPIVEDRVENTRNYLHLNDFKVVPSDDTRYPFIKTESTFKDLFYNKHSFSVFVEEILLCEVSDFREAILCLLASYYVFNISYHPTNRNTLMFMERVFLESHETPHDSEEDKLLLQHVQQVLLKKRAKYKLPQLNHK